ncbi:uncharacterized protein LOC143459705 [Clavelina lepadiformis]|uniref:uncharacterized protein LOC143459705 n=1 Tax=Clavelina lepadiformis TaxID=159417 RepID=UPI004042BABF
MAGVFQKVLIIVAFLVFVGSLVLAYLNTAGVPGLYYSTNGYVDSKYFQHISPAGIGFSIIWPVIYVWNGVGILYVIVSMWLKSEKSPVNVSPTLISTPFLCGYTLAWGSTVGWLFAFDAEILELSLALLLLAAFSAYFAIGASCKLVYDNQTELLPNSKVMVWLVRIFIQNGLCLPATWLTIACFINLGDVIIYQDSFNVVPPILRGTLGPVDGSTLCLSLLGAYVGTWFVLENFILEKYCRYNFTIYPVLILGLSALISRLQPLDNASGNLIIASVQLGIVVLAFCLRIFIALFRWKKGPVKIHDDATISNVKLTEM